MLMCIYHTGLLGQSMLAKNDQQMFILRPQRRHHFYPYVYSVPEETMTWTAYELHTNLHLPLISSCPEDPN